MNRIQSWVQLQSPRQDKRSSSKTKITECPVNVEVEHWLERAKDLWRWTAETIFPLSGLEKSGTSVLFKTTRADTDSCKISLWQTYRLSWCCPRRRPGSPASQWPAGDHSGCSAGGAHLSRSAITHQMNTLAIWSLSFQSTNVKDAVT